MSRHSINHGIQTKLTEQPPRSTGTGDTALIADDVLFATYYPCWLGPPPCGTRTTSASSCSGGDAGCSGADCGDSSDLGALIVVIIVIMAIIFVAILLAPFIVPLITWLGAIIVSACVFIFNIATFGVFRDLFQRVYVRFDAPRPENLRLALLEISSKGGVPNIRGVSVTGFLACRIGAAVTVLGGLSTVLVYIMRNFYTWIETTYYLIPAGLLAIGLFVFAVGAFKVRGARAATRNALSSPSI
ncbi:MAG: hypothetical protein ACFFCZ_29005 [Promethearchaeota archaeon]